MHVSGTATLIETITIGEVVRIPFNMYAEQDPAQIIKSTANVSIDGVEVPRASFIFNVIENPLQFAVTNLGIGSWPQGSTMTLQAEYRVRVTDYPPSLGPDDWHELLVRGQAVLLDLTRRVEALEGAVPVNTPPVSDEQPTLTGVPEVGSVLTVHPGSWLGYPVPVLTHQWTRDGGDISGQTALTYTVVAGDAGKAIACREIATNSSGTASSSTNSVLIDVGAPVVTPNQEFTVSRPLTTGQIVGTVLASGSPTSWAFTLGNANGYWAIDNAGVITLTPHGAENVTDGLSGPKVAATNEHGTSSGEIVWLTVAS